MIIIIVVISLSIIAFVLFTPARTYIIGKDIACEEQSRSARPRPFRQTRAASGSSWLSTPRLSASESSVAAPDAFRRTLLLRQSRERIHPTIS